jgi:dinuclear metal center YbgI/SA1388 family protein
MTTVRHILNRLHEWAPPETALEYDNVGLLVGDPSATVNSALIALDLTHEVAAEATDLNADLIVTHHPLIFHPLKRLRADDPASAIAYELVRSGRAHIAAHTNMDVAPQGVSYALARQLGLDHIEALEPRPGTRKKLVTFVPEEAAPRVRTALARAGAGQIGMYDSCAFEVGGTGYFRAGEGARPAIGEAGSHVEQVQELRLEIEVSPSQLDDVVTALKAVHPYEEVAFDIYRLENESRDHALGAIGQLSDSVSLASLLTSISNTLHAPALRYCGADDMEVRRVAVCGGSGRALIPVARAAGADAFITADISYHSFFDTTDESGAVEMAIVDAGHYETEVCSELILLDRLSNWFPGIRWHRTRLRTSLMKVFVTRKSNPA